MGQPHEHEHEQREGKQPARQRRKANLPIGKQLAAYARQDSQRQESPSELRFAAAPTAPAAPDSRITRRGTYAPLSEHLSHLIDRARVTMTFVGVERILGRALPASARRHRPWWANSGTSHNNARAWLDAGWRVSNVDFNGARATFDRSHGR